MQQQLVIEIKNINYEQVIKKYTELQPEMKEYIEDHKNKIKRQYDLNKKNMQDTTINYVKQYTKQFGQVYPIQSYICDDGFQLGARLCSIKHGTNKEILNEVNELFGFDIRENQDQVDIIKHTKQFIQEFGQVFPQHLYKSPDGFTLGGKLFWMKSGTNPEILDQVNELFGFDIRQNQDEIDIIKHVKQYVIDFPGKYPTSVYKSQDGFLLGSRLNNIKNCGAHKDLLPKINKIFGFNIQENQDHLDILKHLKEYIDTQNRPKLTNTYKSPDGFTLGSKIKSMRNNKTNPEIQDQVNELLSKM